MITIDQFVIDADKYQFIVREERIRKKGKHIGDPYFKDVAFLPKLQDCIRWIFEHNAREIVHEFSTVERAAQAMNDVVIRMGVQLDAYAAECKREKTLDKTGEN